MKKHIIILLSLLTLASCQSLKKSWEFQTYKGKPIAVGEITPEVLQHEKLGNWYKENYQSYQLDNQVINALKNKLNDMSVEVYMGTWCPDSRAHVPAFMKILDAVGFGKKHLRIHAFERNYKDNPLAKEKNIIRVPTFIIKRNGKELGRIIEYPMETLEKDLLKILEGNYKHELQE